MKKIRFNWKDNYTPKSQRNFDSDECSFTIREEAPMKYRIKKEGFCAFDWIEDAKKRWYHSCPTFQEDVRWFMTVFGSDKIFDTEIVTSEKFLEHLSVSGRMKQHLVDEAGFIEEERAELPELIMERRGDHYTVSLKQSPQPNMLTINLDGVHLCGCFNKSVGFPTDSNGRIKIVD